MTDPRTPSTPDPDGIRIVRERAPIPKAALLAFPAAVIVLLLVFFPRSTPPMPSAGSATAGTATLDSTAIPAPVATVPAAPTPPELTATSLPAQMIGNAAPVPQAPAARPSAEDNDIARHFRPGDEAPTAAELIQALRDAGETGGIAAFNPPGTSPPLAGLAVPPDFPLPPGYVRHHQFTDDGEPIEPILMFAPDFVLRDADGKPIPLPENRVVPPELAPPGLPLRPIEIPTP